MIGRNKFSATNSSKIKPKPLKNVKRLVELLLESPDFDTLICLVTDPENSFLNSFL